MDPAACLDLATCQARLDWATHTQRERYPVYGTQSRAAAYPALFTNPRTYHAACEANVWFMEQLKAYLSQFIFRRKVEKFGQVTLFANTYAVGLAYRRAQVEIRLDPLTEEWLIADEQGNLIHRLPCQEFDDDLIRHLQLAQRRRSS